MMDELVQWLRVQLDEDERVAREAGSRALTWPARGTWYLEGVEHNVVGEEEAFCHQHNVEHIARHDPARVLREVEAKRRILARHAPMSAGSCDWCWGNDDKAAWPCADVRDVASVYSDRPGYREEWRP